MLTQLTCYRLLQGWRGRPAADVESLVDVVVSVSRLIAANNEIAEVEINPVRVAESGAIAVDALVLTATGDDAEATGEDAEAGSEDAASTAAAPVHRTNDVSEEMRA
ncbi:acetyl-CoA synthetase, putative [Mycobacteroides abscessus subsp. abscessus]|nr:acetyl-CoA synthetase, putative [Mycobacteroides abscessus subsp. abscessus]